ncbi:MAG TPA: hypothetical protein VGF75_00255, partial [Candidatus Saccharimonadales bacterium]
MERKKPGVVGRTRFTLDRGDYLRSRIHTPGQPVSHQSEVESPSGSAHNKPKKLKTFTKFLKLPAKRLHRFIVKPRSKAQKWQISYFSLLVLALIAFIANTAYTNNQNSKRYDLSASMQKIIATPDVGMSKELSYSSKSASYTLNQAAFKASTSSDTFQAGSGNTAATTAYGATLPLNSNKGLSFVDKSTQLSFSLAPEFKTLKAEPVNASGQPVNQLSDTSATAHLVYPVEGLPAVDIQTPENNGVQDDFVLTKSPSDGKLSISYKLNIGSNLAARLMPGGDIGIYSASSALYGNISYGSNS